MDTTFFDSVAKYGVAATICLYAASLIIPKMFSARTDTAEETARTSLISGLSSRIDALEKAQADQMAQFDAERKRRLDAESQVAALSARISRLEQQLRDLGHTPQ